MYSRVLIPLDRSEACEGVFPMIKDLLAPNAEVILLHVIPPARSQIVGAT